MIYTVAHQSNCVSYAVEKSGGKIGKSLYQAFCHDIELIEKYLEHGSFDINSSGLQLLLKNYMTKSKYSYTNIGHQGLGIDGYVKISSAARRAMDALAVYVLYDLYINRSTDDLDSKYYYWEKEIKYWCEYANNKASDNITFMEQYNYLSSKGKILERRK